MLASGQLFYTATTMKSTSSICCSIILAIIVHVVPGSGLALRSDLAIKVTEELKMIVASRNKANTLENQSEGARNLLACDSVRGSQIKLIVLHVSAGHPSSTRCPPL